MTSVATRPKLCPCKNTCAPIYNALVADPRIKDEEADLNQGYSGDCVGRMNPPIEFIYGGNVHHNNLNHCCFTPLKGVIRFQMCADDFWLLFQMAGKVVNEEIPICCCECGEDDRTSTGFYRLIPPDRFRPDMTPEEFNNAPRMTYCIACAVRLGLLKPCEENFGIHGRAKYMQR